jgi:hypothetical protein
VTSSGTLTGAFVAQAVNTIFAGPSSGGAATPTFRALTAADIPAVTKLTYVEVSATASTPPVQYGFLHGGHQHDHNTARGNLPS